MFDSLSHILGMLADAQQSGGGFLNNLDAGAYGGGALAAGLGAFWFFFRVIRKVVATLFMLCVVYLVMKLGMGIDISQYIAPLFQK